jgi:hypothetical protein
MSSVVISGDTSGAITVSAPAVAGTNTLTLQAGTATNSMNTLGTSVASTSGTSIDFTGIPAWVKRVTVMLAGVSTNGTSVMQLQLGSSSIQITGYLGSSGAQTTAVGTGNLTSGVSLEQTSTAAKVRHGKMEICLLTSNTYVITGIIGESAAQIQYFGSSVSLTGLLDRIRITTVNGTDTFDAGTINILYEG